ncbi:Beta-citrylglutamate synthase B, partial [Eudyptes filholi]
MCSSVAPRLWFLTDRRIREDYPQQEILRALKAKCCEEELDFRALVMDEVVLTIEDGNLGENELRLGIFITFPPSLLLCFPDRVCLYHILNFFLNLFPSFIVVRESGCGPPHNCQTYRGTFSMENFIFLMTLKACQMILTVQEKERMFPSKAVFLARDKHHLADLSHLIRHDAPYLFQKYVKESHGKDVRVIVVGGRVVGTMLRCSTDGRMQSNCSLGGVGMMCSLSEQGKQLAVQVSNILGMDVCGIDLLMKDDGSFYVCEANANVGFIAFDKACNLDVAGIIADYAASLLTPGRLTRRMSLLSVVSTASETSEPELGPPASAAVDNMSASSSSVDSDPETTERELLTKLPGALFNMNQLLANEIKLLVE